MKLNINNNLTLMSKCKALHFDLAQTDGDPLPDLGAEELTASVENFDIFMDAIRGVSPVPIRFDEIASGAKGYYSNADKEIVIQSGMGEMQTMKTAVHECAHAILHDKDVMQEQGIQKDQMTREVEAESVAFATLAHFELDTSEYSFPYIAGWSSGRDTKELKASLDTIRRTASEIIDGIEGNMREQILERQGQTAEAEIDLSARKALLSERFQEITLFDVPMLYSNGRVERTALPEGIYCYDLRGSDYDSGKPIRLEGQVAVNHAASVLGVFPVDIGGKGFLRLGEELNFDGGEASLGEYIEAAKGLNPAVQAEHMENAIGRADETRCLDGGENRFAIYQLDEREDLHGLRFMGSEYLKEYGLPVEAGNYHYIYGGRLAEGETLDGIYERFNVRHPDNYAGHSLSVSDVVVLQRGGEAKAYYVDSFGFSEIDGFIEERRRISEREHRIEDAYINSNSLGIIVDGHEGTWRSLYAEEINGETFYLMESQEYGDTAANILLHMDGDLVAEDLWNGVDYGAMQAVKEYFDRKGIQYEPLDFPLQERYAIDTAADGPGSGAFLIMDHVTGYPVRENGEVKTYNDRAGLTSAVEEMNRANRIIYRESAQYARDHGQLGDYRASMQENIACKQGIEAVIRENFDGMHLNPGVLKPVIDRFGEERVAYVLANTVQQKSYDGRFSHANKEWAASIPIRKDTDDGRDDHRDSFVVDSHPAVLDGFIDLAREHFAELQASIGQAEKDRPLTADSVTRLKGRSYMFDAGMKEAIYEFDCLVDGEPAVLTYSAGQREYFYSPMSDRGEMEDIFSIHTDREDIWNRMPETELSKLETVLAGEAEAFLVEESIAKAASIHDLKDVDYGLMERESTSMTGEQKGRIRDAMSRKGVSILETAIASAGSREEWQAVQEALQEAQGIINEGPYKALLEKTEKMEAPKEPALRFFVAECMEFPVLGEYHEAQTFAEAVKLYGSIPEDRSNGIKGIGFLLDDGSDYDGSYPLVEGGKVVTEKIGLVPYYSSHPLVQEAVKEAKQYFPLDVREAGYQPREAQKEASVTVEKTVDAEAPSQEKREEPDRADSIAKLTEQRSDVRTSGKKESVLKALRERQAQAKEREKQAPEQKDKNHKKGEQSL